MAVSSSSSCLPSLFTLLSACSNARSTVARSFLKLVRCLLFSSQVFSFSWSSSSLSMSSCSNSRIAFSSLSLSCLFCAIQAFFLLWNLSIFSFILSLLFVIACILAFYSVSLSLVIFVASLNRSAFSERIVIPSNCSIIARWSFGFSA